MLTNTQLHNTSAIQTTVTNIQSEATCPLLLPNSQPHMILYVEMAIWPSPFADSHYTDVVAKAKIADQCVIVKPTTELAMSTIAKSTKKDLVTDINKALSLAVTTVDGDLAIVPDEHRVVRSQKLTSGGVMYIFNSDEAAAWLCEPGAGNRGRHCCMPTAEQHNSLFCTNHNQCEEHGNMERYRGQQWTMQWDYP